MTDDDKAKIAAYFEMRKRNPEIRELGFRFEGLPWVDEGDGILFRCTKDYQWSQAVYRESDGTLHVSFNGPGPKNYLKVFTSS